MNTFLHHILTNFINEISYKYNIDSKELHSLFDQNIDIKNLLIDFQNINTTQTRKGNTQKSSKQQMKQVKTILEKHGFHAQTDTNRYTCLTYKEQPNGTQKFPDFCLYNGHKTLYLELKKSNSNTIMWNDGFPKAGTLYLISCKNGTLFCMGETLFTDKDKKCYEIQCEKLIEFNTQMKNQSESDFTFYSRKAISQKINFKNENNLIQYNYVLKCLQELVYFQEREEIHLEC